MKSSIDYDDFADVLYVTFGSGEPSYCEEIDDLLLIERGMFSKIPTGLRIINLRNFLDGCLDKYKIKRKSKC